MFSLLITLPPLKNINVLGDVKAILSKQVQNVSEGLFVIFKVSGEL